MGRDENQAELGGGRLLGLVRGEVGGEEGGMEKRKAVWIGETWGGGGGQGKKTKGREEVRVGVVLVKRRRYT